ncbi:MAG: hypothetical protein JXJ20_05120 [Anaerolineae bacterium]|nr:hypothetical protein [Anaerolineae bacterium]
MCSHFRLPHWFLSLVLLILLTLPLTPALAQGDEWTCDEGPNDILNAAQAAFDEGDLDLAYELVTEAQSVCANNIMRSIEATQLLGEIETARNPVPTTAPSPTPALASPWGGPVAQAGHTMAYDVESDRVVLVGGANPIGVWTYEITANEWQCMDSDQAPYGVGREGSGAMAYDTQSDRVILFVGVNYGLDPDAPLSETWAYDLNTNTWTNMQPDPIPTNLLGSMVYDAESDRIILFGAGGGEWDDPQTWAYDFDTNTWTNMNAGNSPSPRFFHQMAYDAGSDLVIMWGGAAPGGDDIVLGGVTSYIGGWVVDNTWTYDYNANTWTEMPAVPGPGPRSEGAVAYAPSLDRVILFGGRYDVRQECGDTWAYDVDAHAWELLSPDVFPDARSGAVMVYSTGADQIVLFGGDSESGLSDETWLYEPDTNTWVNMTPSP